MKKFFKQFLPLILSVALAFQSLPTDVYAAASEYEQTVTDADVEEAVSDSENADIEDTSIDAEEELVNDGAVTSAVIDFTKDYDESLTSLTYKQGEENPFAPLISNLKNEGLEVKAAGDDEVSVNSADLVNNSLDFIWSEDKDGKIEKLADGSVPVNAGKYLLEIKPIDKAVISAETVSIDCVINKATLKYAVDWNNTFITNKTTVGELKKQITENAYFEGMEGIKTSTYIDDSKMNIIVKLANQDDSAALKDDVVLDRLSEIGYVFKITAPTADSNYEVVEEYSAVRFNDRIATKVEITWPDKADKTWVEYTYTGKEVVTPAVKTVFDFSIVTNDEEKAEVKYDTSEVEYYFADMDGNRLDSAPVNAGSYKYVVSYTDSTGVYENAEASFNVIINPAYITVSPSIDKNLKFFYGQTAADVLANVTYSVDGLLSGTSFDKKTFWGVSVGNQNVTQSFEPVFAVQQKDNNDKNADWENISNSSSLKKDYSYRIVLTGYKAIYGAESISTPIDDTSVQAAERNYVVDRTNLYQEKQVYVFTSQLQDTANYVIDPTALLLKDKSGNNGLAMETDKDNNKKLNASKIYTKIYDGNGLYPTRSDYKKAVLKDSKGTVLNDVKASDLSYVWYSFELVTIDVDGNKVELDNNKDNPYALNSTYKKTKYNELPKDVGYYELEISYSNPETGIVAEPVVVYYHIEPQLLKLSVSEAAIPGGAFNVYSGETIDFEKLVANINADNYRLMLVDNNDLKSNALTDSGFEYDKDFEVYGEYYYDDAGTKASLNNVWSIYKSTTVKDNEDVDSISYNLVNKSNTYELGLPYRARANVEFYEDSLNNNYKVVADSYKINVKQMGNIALRFVKNDEAVKALTTKKVYDAEGFAISYNGLVRVYTQIGDEDVTNKIGLEYYWKAENEDKFEVCPADAGKYTLFVKFAGDDNYDKLTDLEIAEFEIVPRKVTIKPISSNDIIAGLYTSAYYENRNNNHEINQMLDRVNPFTIEMQQIEGTPVYEDFLLSTILPYALDDSDEEIDVTVTNKENASNLYLRYGVTYSIKIKELSWENEGYITLDGEDYYWNPDNYEFIYDALDFTVEKRSTSSVYAITDSDYSDNTISKTYTKLAAQKTDAAGNVVITPIGGIPFYEDTKFNGDFTEIKIPGVIVDPRVAELGNYAVLRIVAPQEFAADYEKYISNATFYNSIKDANGYVVGYDKANGTIDVAFLVKDGETEKKFEITWEDGYTETFLMDLTQSALLSDIYAATEPKTLAFNVANKNMIVGQSQHLDVKLTKKIYTDIVDLRYRVISGTAVNVTSDGYATAVEPGKAVIEVYPVYMDENGVEKEFETWKKVVKVAISVKNVSTPKIKSVYAYDDKVTVAYQIPTDGYRQEVYIVPGKNIKPADIEAKIDAMKSGNFEGANYVLDAEIYIGDRQDSKYNNITNNVATLTINGLEPNQDYTVYVRNVSAMEELESGSAVVLSAAGSTKPIHTQKAQLDYVYTAFEAYVDDDNYPDSIIYPYVTRGYDDYIQKTVSGNCYSVSVNQKTIQLSSYGEYALQSSNEDAEYFDRTQLMLPLTKEQAENYQAPKLSYYAITGNPLYEYNYSFTKSKVYNVKIGDRYYTKSSIATVDKKGKVTLKGVGRTYIVAFDANTGMYDYTVLDITSPLTSITAKNVKVAVGNWFYPVQESYLTYYDGTTKLINGASYYPVKVTVESGTGLVQQPNSNSFYVKEANQTVTLKITPVDYPSAATTMTVTTSAMATIKGLKAYDVTDHTAKLKFNFAATSRSNLKFDLRVTDAKNQLIYTDIIYADDSEYYLNNAEYLDSYDYSAYEKLVYIADKNLYIYNLDIKKYERLANLKISLTPIFDNDVIGKTAQTKCKTTNVPASYVNHLNVKKDMVSTWGPRIYVYANDNAWDADLSDVNYLTANNTFTLRLSDLNNGALTTGSDTVTWKSTNSKVATVKAVGYGASATLKTNRSGETIIECTSKVTKKVICRYKVYVKAAGQGTFTYGAFNDFDDVQIEDLTYEQLNGAKILTEKNPVRLVPKSGNDYVLVKFTAPSDGYYKIIQNNNTIFNGWLNEGDLIPRFVNYSDYRSVIVKVTGTHYNRLNVGAEVKGNVVFYAPNSGVYAVYEFVNGNKEYKNVVVLKAAEQYTYTANASTTVGIEKVSAADVATDKLQVSELASKEVKFVAYTAPYAGKYVFTSKDSVSKNIVKSYQVSKITEDGIYTPNEFDAEDGFRNAQYASDGSMNLLQELTLDAGDIVIIKLEGGEDKAKTEINITKPTIEEIKDGEEMSYVNSVGETVWYKYAIDDHDTLYKLSVLSVSSANVSYSIDGINGTYNSVGNEETKELYGITDLEDVKEIYVKVVPTEKDKKAEAKFKLTKVVPTDLSGTKNFDEPAVSTNTINYYVFTADEYGVYEWSAIATNGKADYNEFFYITRYNQGFGVSWDTDNVAYGDHYHKELTLKKGESVYFTVTGMEYVSEASKTVVKVQAIEPTDVKENADTNIAFGASNKNTYKYYKFTAKSTAEYNLSFTNVSSNMVVEYSPNGINDNYDTIWMISNAAEKRVSLNAGSSIIIRVNVTDEKEATAKLKITDATNPVFESGKAVTVSENGGNSTTRTMIVDEPSRFKVTYDWTKFKDTEVEINGTTYSDGAEFVEKEVGKKLNITIRNSVSTNEVNGKIIYTATPTVKIEKVVSKDIELDKTETVKVSYHASIAGSRYEWFRFVVPASGRYQFKISNTTKANVDVGYAGEKITNDVAGNDLNDKFLTKGDVYYIRAGVDSAKEKDGVEQTQTYEFTIIKNGANTEEVKLDEKSKDITISENEAYFTFTAPDDDYYTIDLVSGNNTNHRTLATAKNTDGFKYGEGIYKLRTGDVVTIKVSAATGADTRVADNVIVKKLPYTIVEAGKTVEVKFTNSKKDSNAKQYFLFKYPESGMAEYGFTKVSDGVKLNAESLNNNFDLGEIKDANFASIEGEVNADNLFWVTASAEEGDFITADFKVDMVTYNELDTAEVKIDLKKGERYYYTFKPTDAGRYIISMEDVQEPLTSRVDDSDTFSQYYYDYYEDQLNSADFVTTEEMVFDGVDNFVQGYVYTVSPNGIRTTLKFQKVTATENLQLISDNKIEVEKGKAVWAAFKAPSTGYYMIQTTKTVSADTAIYNRMDTIYETSVQERKLNAGQTIFVRVENTGEDKGNAVVSVTNKIVDTVKANDSFKVDASKNGEATEKYGIYTAEETGYHEIKLMTPVRVTMRVGVPYSSDEYVDWDNRENDGSTTYSYNKTVFLLAGQEITFVAKNSSDMDAAVTVEVKKSATYDSIKTVELNGKEGYAFYYATKDGVYRFENATPGTTLYYQLDSNDKEGYNIIDSSAKSLSVKAGHYVFFKLENRNASETNRITSTIGVFEPVTVKEGEDKLAAGESKTITFVAPHSTYYIFDCGSNAYISVTHVEGNTSITDASCEGRSTSVKLTEGREYTFTFRNDKSYVVEYKYSIKNN